MQRMGMVIGVTPDQIATYKRLRTRRCGRRCWT